MTSPTARDVRRLSARVRGCGRQNRAEAVLALTVPDYGTYIAQLKTNVDGIFLGFAGSNGFRFFRQFNEYGLRGKVAVVGGMTAFDEAVLQEHGRRGARHRHDCWYSARDRDADPTRGSREFPRRLGYDPGFYAARRMSRPCASSPMFLSTASSNAVMPPTTATFPGGRTR